MPISPERRLANEDRMIAVSKAPTVSLYVLNKTTISWASAGTSHILLNPKIHLFTAVAGPITPTLTPGSFTEATFPGYAFAPVSPIAYPVNLGANNGLAVAYETIFSASSSITSPGQSIAGYWMDDGATHVYVAELFPQAVNFVYPYDWLALTLLVPIPYVTFTYN
jgi:hypothetical protein